MDQPKPAPKGDLKPKTPKWSSPFWYLPIMLLMLWLWQSTMAQFSYRTIPYSEFKGYLARHEVVKCVVRDDDIQGEITPKTAETPRSQPPTNSVKSAGEPKAILFRTIRVEDPKLVDELQAANVQFRGERPSFMSQFLVSWIVPIAVMVLIWSFIGKRLGSAGESILSFGKSK